MSGEREARPGVLAVASPCALAFAGAWLLAAPATFDYAGHPAARGDWAAGVALLLLSVAMLRPAWTARAQWAAALAGAWLLFAPLAFRAPPAAYANDLLAGLVAVTFSMLLPRAPVERALPGGEIPPGWNYNPSAGSQRAPIIALAALGFFLAQYMAAYQLGYHDAPWDPFFGDGTRRVLDSSVSEAFPVSDAGLGAFAYLVEALTGFAGGARRWRTMPWMVLFFGVMVVPAGAASLVLIMLQPVAVGAWCGFCLLTALTTLLMISPAADEALASLQYLARARRGKVLWAAFWGLRAPAGEDAVEAPLPQGDGSWVATALGMSRITPTLAVSAALGAWVMLAPTVFGTEGRAADSDYLAGPLVISVSVVALADVGRTARWLNLPLALWIGAAPWFLDGATQAARGNAAVAAVLLVACSLPKGRIGDRFGSFDKYIV